MGLEILFTPSLLLCKFGEGVSQGSPSPCSGWDQGGERGVR